MHLIENTKITDDIIVSGTSVAEPAAGETEWQDGHSYTVGDKVIRKTTHRVYKCADDHTSSGSLLPEDAPDKWVDIGPTQRWAPFDEYVNTQAKDVGEITFVLSPGYFNTFALYGLVGERYELTIRDGQGGNVIWQRSGGLVEDPVGWYEYLFLNHQLEKIDRLFFSDLPIRPNAELTIKIEAGEYDPVAIGMILVGDLQPLVPDEAAFGGVTYGATVTPGTYSYIKRNEDGTVEIVRRHSATDLRCTVVLPKKFADRAVSILQHKLDRPLAWIAVDESVPHYRGLNVYGIAGTAPVTYDSFNMATIELNIQGMI